MDPSPPPPTLRSLAPRGLADWLAVGSLALLLFAFSAFDVHTYDTGLYVAKGRYTLQHWEIPTPDKMLCSDRKADVSHTEKWLFQVVVYALDAVGGPTALVLFGMLSVFTTFALLALAARGSTGGWVIPAWAALLGCLVGYERFTMRPELITFPMAAAYIFIFERYHDRTSRWLWLLPALQVLWTNCHPVFPMGPLLCGLYAGDPILRGAVPAWRDERWPASIPAAAVWQRVWVGCAVTAACLVNPHFVDGALYPFRFYSYIQEHAEILTRHVTEFKGTFDYETFPTWATTGFSIALVAILAVLAANLRHSRPVHHALFFAFAWLACSLRRNLGVFAVVAVPVFAINFHGALAAVGKRVRIPRELLSVAGAFVLLAVSIWFAIDLMTNRFYVAEREPRRFGFGLTTVSYPVDAVRYIDAEGLHGNAFTNWDAGSYLLWAAYPKSKPYISSEGDYSFALYDEYRKVLSGEIPFQSIFDRYNVRYALIRYPVGDTKQLVEALAKDAGWALTYGDATTVVFLRRNAENSAAIAKTAGRDPIRTPETSGGTPFERAQPWFRLSILYDLVGRVDDSTRALRRAIELYPAYAEAHHNLGAGLAGAKEFRGAESEFRAAIEANPHYFTPYLNLGLLYYTDLKDYAKAESVYREALAATLDKGGFRTLGAFFRSPIALQNREILLCNALGKCLYQQKKFDEAEESLKQSITVADNYEGHMTLFLLYRDELKDPERAERHWRKAQELAPEGSSGS